jgi:hypothetical protein
MQLLLVWCLTLHLRQESRCDVDHKVEKAKRFWRKPLCGRQAAVVVNFVRSPLARKGRPSEVRTVWVTEAACWAHARRKFFDEHAQTKSPLALEALQRIAVLYQIEAMVRGQATGVLPATHAAKKQERTLARICDLAAAIPYTLSGWQPLTLMLRDRRAGSDSGGSERRRFRFDRAGLEAGA